MTPIQIIAVIFASITEIVFSYMVWEYSDNENPFPVVAWILIHVIISIILLGGAFAQ